MKQSDDLDNQVAKPAEVPSGSSPGNTDDDVWARAWARVSRGADDLRELLERETTTASDDSAK